MTEPIVLTALITGASGGIGRATALRLAQPLSPPYAVRSLLLHYHTADAAKRDAITAELAALHPDLHVVWLQADMGDTAAVDALISAAQKAAAAGAGDAGTPAPIINVLFANHGTHLGHAGPATGALGAVPLDVFERTWRVNTLAAYHLTQRLAPPMAAAGFGRVVYTSSVAGVTGGIVGPHYASAKAALHGLCHFVAGALAPRGVTVNVVAPALIAGTAMLPAGEAELRAKIPVGRLGAAAEVAEVVRVMVENGYVSNKVWAVDGGMVPM